MDKIKFVNIENKIREFIENFKGEGKISSISIGVCFNNKNIRNKFVVSSEKYIDNIYFDLASLTKPYAIVLSILVLIKNGKIKLTTTLGEIFDIEYISDIKNQIKIEDLLSHSSGYIDHRDYYKKLNEVDKDKRKDELLEYILKGNLVENPGKKVIYSDVGYMLLGFIIEKISKSNLDDFFRKEVLEPIALENNIFFNHVGSNIHTPEEFAPVEDCLWRGKILQGEVSDENCWILGGVAGHAGLYGDIKGALDLTELIMDIWLRKRSHPNIDSKDLVYFLKRRKNIKDNTWALGFDTPTQGKSTSGKYFSTNSVGHLGFTGTSFWIDPERQLVIVILTNRVHPNRDNELIKEFRPAMHDKIIEWLNLQTIS